MSSTPPMSGAARRLPDGTLIRLARPDDNDALVALAEACPMRAAVSLSVHRDPDFFALSRLMGDPWYLFVADHPDAGVVGCVAGGVRPTWLGGRPTDVMVTGDFKLHPRFRGRGLADELLRAGWPRCEAHGTPSLMAALAGNAPVERRVLNPPAGIPKPGVLGTVRVYTLVLPGLSLRPAPRGLGVRAATDADLPAMMTLWQRIAPGRDGAPVLDAPSFLRFLDMAPGLSLSDYLLVHRGTELVGSVGVWDPRVFKETRVLDYGRSIAVTRRVHNLVARALSWPTLPGRGGSLPALQAVHLCADSADVLAALVRGARDRSVAQGAVAFELGLDPRDPLTRGLRGFARIGVDIRVYLSPPPGSARVPGPSDRPLHFETALV